MIGRQLPFFSLIVPFWLIWAFVGFRKMMEVWPALLVAGVSFAIPQYLVSNFHGPWLVDIVAAIVSMVSLALFLRVWQPKRPMTEAPRDWSSEDVVDEAHEHPADVASRRRGAQGVDALGHPHRSSSSSGACRRPRRSSTGSGSRSCPIAGPERAGA